MLDERLRRLWAAAEARALGRGGVTMVSAATGISRRAIHLGLRELREPPMPGRRIRREGGGRKRLVDQDPALADDLERLIEPLTRGDPESPLRWTCKSTRQLAAELQTLRGIGREAKATHLTFNKPVLESRTTGDF